MRHLVALPNGILAVYKPQGITSSNVVEQVKRLLVNGAKKSGHKKVKIKVGHGGTLDPLATGVLVLGIGDGTKLLSSYLKGDKGYRAVGKLGMLQREEFIALNVFVVLFKDIIVIPVYISYICMLLHSW